MAFRSTGSNRYYAERLDYVGRILIQHCKSGLAGFLIGIILIQIGKHRYIGDFLFGISFLLFALGMLNQTGRDMDLAHNPAVVNFFASFDSRVALSGLFRTFASTLITTLL